MSAEPDPGAFRPPRFEVTVEEAADSVLLRISGELDLVSEPQLNHALEQTAGRDATLDLSELAFMDSTGLRTLLEAHSGEGGERISFVAGNDHVQGVFRLSGLLEELPFRAPEG